MENKEFMEFVSSAINPVEKYFDGSEGTKKLSFLSVYGDGDNTGCALCGQGYEIIKSLVNAMVNDKDFELLILKSVEIFKDLKGVAGREKTHAGNTQRKKPVMAKKKGEILS